MRQPAPPTSRKTSGRFRCAVAVLGVLALPVGFRGGAQTPHPHALFQLWHDAADGAADHHRRGDGHDAAAHERHRAEPAQPVRGELPPDVPVLSSLSSTVGLSFALAAITVFGLVLLFGRPSPSWSAAAALVGRRPRPDTPPPRPAAAPC